MRKVIYFGFILVLIVGCSDPKPVDKPYVVMLSLDGFRWDYAEDVLTPNLDRIAKIGVKAESIKSSFPTKTFPNHYSIATGLYPDHHGIVQNSFHDPESDRYYALFDRTAVEDGTFYGGEPIWVTAEKQGIVSGSYFWVGSEAAIQGIRPTYWKKYDHKFPYEQRIDSVISWLQKPEDVRPHLVLWYMDEPDHTGHYTGPESEELDSVIMHLDKLVGIFLDKLKQLPFADQINVIVTSDHGMCKTSNERKVVLENSITMDWVETMQGYNPNYVIKAKEGYIDSLMIELKETEHITSWKSDEIPERLNYGTHPRTLDIVVVADSSWSVVLSENKNVGKGAHGYDNNNTDMDAIFYAYGPAFKVNYISPTFNNVDIYPLIAHILNLQPAEVDGTFENVKKLLKE